MPLPEKVTEQKVKEYYIVEDLKFSPKFLKNLWVNNVLTRTLARLVGWTGKRPVMLRCTSDGRLHTTTVGSGKLTGSYCQVPIIATATLIKAGYDERLDLVIENQGTADVYVGFNDAVTIGNGLKLAPGASISFSQSYLGAVYGIVAAGTESVGYMEI